VNYLARTSRALWPAPAQVTIGRRSSAYALSEFVMVPSAGDPRLLVPSTSRRAAAAAVLGYNKERSSRARLKSRALWAALASGLGQIVFRDRLVVEATPTTLPVDTIETYLRGVLAPDLLLSWHIGPARANRKPVLQLLTPAGRTVGFAKVGINELTRELVRAERRNLDLLAQCRLGAVTAPRVLHSGGWQGLEILVQEALPMWRRRDTATHERLVRAMRDVASVRGVTNASLSSSGYWRSLRAKTDRASGSEADGLRFALDRIAAADAEPVSFGAWHGDWTPWNMAVLPGTTLVWDWERFTVGVPVGFDALHYELQHAIVGQRVEPRVAAADCMRDARRLLAPFGVAAERSEQIALLYLVEIATRYLLDGQAAAGSRLGRLNEWLMPEIVDAAARLSPAMGGN
jgi:phosphotransferase family enzyme